MLIIAEKINGTRKSVNKAVLERDAKFIQDLAKDQVAAGGDVIDINAGTPTDREPDDVIWLVNTVQEIVDKPICLDSPNPKALVAGLSVCKQPPMINSISGEPERLSNVLPVVAKSKLKVLALAMDSSIIPATCEGRMKVVRKLFEETRKVGLPDDYVYVDPLALSVATATNACLVTLDTMRAILKEYPQAHLTGGLSNVSFGLPARSLINRAFLTLAIEAGLDSAIIDPMDKNIMETLYAANAVLGKDKFCNQYGKAYRAGKIGVKPEKKAVAQA